MNLLRYLAEADPLLLIFFYIGGIAIASAIAGYISGRFRGKRLDKNERILIAIWPALILVLFGAAIQLVADVALEVGFNWGAEKYKTR